MNASVLLADEALDVLDVLLLFFFLFFFAEVFALLAEGLQEFGEWHAWIEAHAQTCGELFALVSEFADPLVDVVSDVGPVIDVVLG